MLRRSIFRISASVFRRKATPTRHLAAFALSAICAAMPVACFASGIDTAPGTTSLPLNVEGKNVMTLLSSGNVGIGTTDPVVPLHVAGADPAGWSIFVDPSLTAGASGPGFALGQIGGVSAIQTFAQTNLVLLPYGGNVGIGTTAPQSLLHIQQSTDSQGNSLAVWNKEAQATWLWEDSSGNFRIDSGGAAGRNILLNSTGAGSVGIGTTAPQRTLEVNGGSQFDSTMYLTGGASIVLDNVGGAGASDYWIGHGHGGGVPESLAFYAPAGQSLEFGIANNAYMIMNTTGLNIGNGAAPPYTLTVNGTAYASGAAGALSDRRHKTDIELFTADALKIVKQLKPVTFRWKEPKDDGMKGEQIGFIAQDVQPVLPDVVMTANDADKTLGLKYDSLIPVLAKAIQEQQAEIKAEKQKEADEIKLLRDQLAELREQLHAREHP